MADIRIKDLTTTASSTASDDFIAVDGTTNGTRKLNAFSPTFGGNATVTGTLTVSGATGSLGSSASAATSLKLTVGVGTNASPKYRTIDFRNYDDSKSQAYIRAANRETDSNASTIEVAARSSGDVLTSIATFSDSQLSIAATTASTTTSSGALVVSGGVGVGGAMNVGGVITTAGEYLQGSNVNFNIISTATNGNVYLKSNGGTLYLNNTAGNGDIRLGNTGTVAYVVGTSASTSTSSGALVVSGGVGVAGAIYGGGDIISSGNGNIQGGRFTSVNSNSYIEQSGTDFTYVTGGSRPHVFSIGGTTRFQVTTSGIISSLPASAASLTVNSTMTFELTSNTSLKIFVRGSDGTTRSTTLTLA